MIMSGDGKKLAMMIIKGAGHKSEDEKKNADFVDREGSGKPKVEVEVEKELSAKDGMEAAMAKLISAVHSKDIEKAVEAMSEYMTCCEDEPDYSMEPSETV